MKKQMMFTLLALFLLSGCAVHQKITPAVEMKESQSVRGETELSIAGRDFLIEPTESLGIEATPAFREGRVSIYWGTFNEMLLGEGASNRLRWVGLAEGQNGQEYFVQAVRWPLNQLDLNGYYRLKLIVEDGGNYEPVKVVYFSSALHWSYDAFGEEIPVSSVKKLMADPKFRQKFVTEHGTSTEELQQIPTIDFYESLRGWKQYSTPDGTDIYTPLSKENIQKIAGQNPEYSAFQNWIAHGRKPIYLNPVATGVVNGLEVAHAVFGDIPPKGWSLNSVVTRREMAFELKKLAEKYRELVRFWRQKVLK